MRSGRESDAVAHWSRILELHPTHVRALSAMGQRAFQRGDMPEARAAFRRIVDADGTIAQQWIQLAIACRNLYDDQAADEAIRARAGNRSPRARGPDPSRQFARAQRQHARGERGLRRGCGGRSADAAAAARTAPGRRRGEGLCREVQPGKGPIPRSIPGSALPDVCRRGPAPLPHLSRHHGRAQEALRLAVDDRTIFPIWRRSSSSTAPNFHGSTASNRRPTTSGTNSSTCCVRKTGSRPTFRIRPAFRSISSRSSTIRPAGAHSTCSSRGSESMPMRRDAPGPWRCSNRCRSRNRPDALPRRCSPC